jgi:poly(3-hydroxybutyrate) depolymerase
MSRSRLDVRLLVWSAASLLAASSCSSGGSNTPTGEGGHPGNGGSKSGGTSGSGGQAGSGGMPGSGGRSGSGGGNGTGGVAASGGQPGTGGGIASGGHPGSGGATGLGGVVASGGQAGAGGVTIDAGPKGTGGNVASGGATGTGGSGNGGGAGKGVDSGTTTGKSAGCGKAPTIASSQYNNGTSINITAAGMQRRYVLNVPTNYDNTKPYKLVVTLHARDGNDKQMFSWQYYGLLPLSNNTAIFVAPNGQLNGAPCSGTSSSGESSCGWPNTNGSDLALVDAVVAQMEENFCIDTDHIFATGWSYGGSMSYDVACERPLSNLGSAAWGVRAIAIYSGAQLSGNCTPSSPVGYYHSHGTHDSVLDYEKMGMPLAQNFAKANGCTWATPTKVTSGTHVCTNLTGCKTGYPLEFCSFNGDHTPYPDNGQSSGSWGPQEAWKFLSQF